MIYKKRHLFIILPNGKQLCFPEAQLRTNKWGKPEMIYKQELFGKWVTSSTYGAKVLENIAQAISRELLAEAILKLEDEQFPVVLHVHDEIVCEVPDDGTKTLEAMETIMKQPNSWAKGLPLEVEGFSSRRYRK
jgi:DNA polymerase bacteriophage-type